MILAGRYLLMPDEQALSVSTAVISKMTERRKTND
jgi:hypothetical protein